MTLSTIRMSLILKALYCKRPTSPPKKDNLSKNSAQSESFRGSPSDSKTVFNRNGTNMYDSGVQKKLILTTIEHAMEALIQFV